LIKKQLKEENFYLKKREALAELRCTTKNIGEETMKPNPQIVDTKEIPSVKIQLIPRDEIPSLTHIEIGGKTHHLGVLKDFRKHPRLASFLPEQARLSISWTSLKPGEVLSVHEHPTASMIIVCEGEGEIIGDCNQSLKAGDIAAIPPNNKHGFIGRGKKGFWGLSIQFEGLGLYEDREAPRVQFLKCPPKDFDYFLQQQEIYKNSYRQSDLLKLLETPFIQDPLVQDRLLEVLNSWANWFQRIIFARAAMGGKLKFQESAEDHIREEIGHNKNLLMARNNKPIQIWDPILEAAASWFYEQMLSGTDEECTVLVHFVLEASGEIFHTEAAKIFPHIEHFQEHGIDDNKHFEMGCSLLKQTIGLDFNNFEKILQQGWRMMEILCNRMAYIAKYGTEIKQDEDITEKAA